MGEVTLVALLIMGVIAITAVLFGGWLVVTLIKGVAHGIGSLFSGSKPPLPPLQPGQLRCGRKECRCVNPAAARYCRRCGAQILENSRYRMPGPAVS